MNNILNFDRLGKTSLELRISTIRVLICLKNRKRSDPYVMISILRDKKNNLTVYGADLTDTGRSPTEKYVSRSDVSLHELSLTKESEHESELGLKQYIRNDRKNLSKKLRT